MSKKKLSAREYFKTTYQALAKELKVKNPFALPRIKKVSINTGVGKFEKKEIEDVANYLQKLTGQKPKMIGSALSINGFKVRKGEINGAAVTLRGKKMEDFILNLIYLSLPRTKDFKGIKKAAFDPNFGSFSVGVPSATIFPQVGFDATVNFGLQVNIIFRNKTEDNKVLLEKLDFPFKKS